MGFPSQVGFPYEFPLVWGYPAGTGFPHKFPIVWTERYAGQHCFFTFYPKATFQADIALKGEHIKTLMADIAISTHFAVKTFTADLVLVEEKIKTFHADIALLETLTKEFTADINLYARYQPPGGLVDEQIKSSCTPYVKVE